MTEPRIGWDVSIDGTTRHTDSVETLLALIAAVIDTYPPVTITVTPARPDQQ